VTLEIDMIRAIVTMYIDRVYAGVYRDGDKIRGLSETVLAGTDYNDALSNVVNAITADYNQVEFDFRRG